MLSFKASLKILLLVSTFLLLFSTPVFGNNVEEIKYVFYEDGDSIFGRVYVINYQDALEEKDLYDKVADGVFNALMNHKKVWLETVGGNVVDYSKALNNNKSYDEVYDDNNYFTERPDPDYEYYYADGNVLRRRDPVLDEPDDDAVDDDYPDWLVVLDDDADDDKFRYHLETWEFVSKHLLVEIEIDSEKFDKSIHEVKINNYEASRKETQNGNIRWFVGIPIDDLDEDVTDMPKDDVFELKPGMIEVRAGIRWY